MFWGSVFVINVLVRTIFTEFSFRIITGTLLLAVMAIGYTSLFRQLIHKWSWKLLTPLQLLPLGIIACGIVTLVLVGTFLPLFGFLSGLLNELGFEVFFSNFMLTFMIMCIWTVGYFSYSFFERYRDSEIRRWKLEAAVKEAELNNLKSQINPHFMFNALNNIRALILENPRNARKMLTNLSDILRYSINHTKVTNVPLSSEIEIVNNYMELIAIQYEEKLQYRLHVEEGLEQIMVPPMIVQLLVENAIKHGISQIPDGGEVSVKVFRAHEDVVVQVSNTGSLVSNRIPATGKSGLGLQNLKDRLSLLSEKYSFDLSQVDSLVIATIKLPG